MFTKKEIIKKIEENKEIIKSFGVYEIILIGSYARDEASEDSDIDFVVEFESGRGLFDDYIHLVQFIKGIFKKDIEIGDKHLIREELRSAIMGGKKVEAKI